MSIFQNFTNLYPISKTLRFELKPVGNTMKMLEESNVFKKDEIIYKKYQKTKPYFDRLHKEFMEESLKNVWFLDFSKYYQLLLEWKKDKKNKTVLKELKAIESQLRKETVTFFHSTASTWAKNYANLNIKKKDINLLFEEEIFAILKDRYGDEAETQIADEITGEKVSIFDSWKGFTGYFIKFHETRKNFYKDDGTATAIATRIIDQNLRRFCDNIDTFNSIKNKIDFFEIENNFGISLKKIFSLNYYNYCLTRDGINKYNIILGGLTLENGEKKKGINELINKYRQDNKGEKIPFLKSLDKQILSEKKKFFKEIENDKELQEVIRKFMEISKHKTEILKNLFSDFVEKNEEYNLSQIYISKEALNTIAHKWTSSTETFERKLYEVTKEDKLIKYEKKDNNYKFPDFIALSYIKRSLESNPLEEFFWKDRYYEIENLSQKTRWEQFLNIFIFEFNSLFKKKIKDENEKEKTIGYEIFYQSLKELLNKEIFSLNQETKLKIKEFADSFLPIYQMAKYFALEKKRKWLDEYETGDFYENPNFGYKIFYKNAYEEIVQTYNYLRNYLTKKPYSEEKWKLNFEKPTLANGWPDSPDGNTQYCSFIFRNKQKYFLGITDFPTIFDKSKFPEAYKNDKEDFEKMVYKQVDAKTLYGSVYGGIFGTKYSDDQETLTDRELLQRMKQVLETRAQFFSEFSEFIKKIEKNRYETAKELAREISEGVFYNVSFVPISGNYLHKGIYEIPKNKKGDLKTKKLYLFQIKNKDWNKGSTGTKNLHTLYFESLFSKENFDQNFPVKLNGQAEIFYRPKTKEEKLGTKIDNKGKTVINHKRYNENKIFFHAPLTINRTKDDVFKFNAKINNFLANNKNINIIGVDRGEKHLAYYSVIKNNGEIIESGSLNTIKGGNNQSVNYAEKLALKAKKREQTRKDWQEVEMIKNLKKGYISQVVHKLADLAIIHNAIIVFEDLNMRFKQIRGGIEKSVYQQLEKALIEKLNFLVDKKEMDLNKAGHLLKAYQLTAPFDSFQKMGKQTGIIFYTQAAYTSRIDPITGWRPHLYLKYSSAENAKKDIMKFSSIEFKDGRFEFTYNIKNFKNQKEYPVKTTWKVCSCVERYRWNKSLNLNKGGYNHYADVTDCFRKLFEENNIGKNSILSDIKDVNTKGNEKFFKDFIFFFNLICQIRNTDEKAQNLDFQDFIFSPVEPFFDSRKDNGNKLPKNGDDNGAFNIARKGIIILDKITNFANKNGSCEKINWGDLYVSNTEWDNYSAKNYNKQTDQPQFTKKEINDIPTFF